MKPDMGTQNDKNSPVSPLEWYEAGVLLRQEERFGEAINAFARAAELADEEIAAAETFSECGVPPTAGLQEKATEGDNIFELRKIKATSLAFIELIREINSFANTDLMNP